VKKLEKPMDYDDFQCRRKFLKPFYPMRTKYLLTVRKAIMSKNSLRRQLSRGLTFLYCLSIILSMIAVAFPVAVAGPNDSALRISASTDYTSYYFMQTAGFYANLTFNTTPVQDGIIAVQIDGPSGNPVLFRSVKGSQNPRPDLFDDNIEILSVTPMDQNYQPRTYYKRGEECIINVVVRNTGAPKTGLITVSMFDSISMLLSTREWGTRESPNWIDNEFGVYFDLGQISGRTNIGTAKIYVNVFKADPSIYGIYPLTYEKSTTVLIKSPYGSSTLLENYPNSAWSPTGITSLYNFSWKIPSHPPIGHYVTYASSNYTNTTSNYDSTTFDVIMTSMPPQASFTYLPPIPYAGGKTYFDASSSFSYNGTITNYKWTWGDGSPSNNTASPWITHIFQNNGTFLVTLNVTDNLGLWCTTSKLIFVSGPTPPVADFTFTPNPTWRNATTTFDASSSTPGWNGTGNPPIVSYAWNWGDGTPSNVTSSTSITHVFKLLGNFTVTLTVTDKRGWTGSKIRVVPVINVTQKLDIAIQDLTLTGQYEIDTDYYEPYKGWNGYINVTVKNLGTTAETFNVTLYYLNSTSYLIGIRYGVYLPSMGNQTIPFQWDTSVVHPTANYTIRAIATTRPGDTNLGNNIYNATARIKGPGDVDGNGVVAIGDAALVGVNWGKRVPEVGATKEILRAEINHDGILNISDAGQLGLYWGKTYPRP
jgi:hypothetical protein